MSPLGKVVRNVNQSTVTAAPGGRVTESVGSSLTGLGRQLMVNWWRIVSLNKCTVSLTNDRTLGLLGWVQASVRQ